MGTRVVALILAITFFVSTVGFSAFVVYEATRDDEPASNEVSNSSSNNSAESVANEQEAGVLAGTVLTGFTTRDEPVAELEIIDTVEGTGAAVTLEDTITVHYTGALVADGTIFESSKDGGQPISFGLTGLIPGWQEGIPGMKVGGVRRLVIPAEKAYGARDTATIPANSDLVFDIELVGIAE